MNRSINSVLEAIKQTLAVEAQSLTLNRQAIAEAEGEGEATETPDNATDTAATLESYITNIVDNIVQTYEMSEEDALDLVMDVMEGLEKDGIIPPMPSLDEDAETIAVWLGTAKTLMLDSFIYDCMEADGEENPETGGVE